MKTIYSFIVFFLSINFGYSQFYPQWSDSFGSPDGNEQFTKVETDIDGNIYRIAQSGSTYIDNQFIDSHTGSDIILMKFNPSGKLLWYKRMGGEGYYQVALDFTVQDDLIAITGQFLGFINFDTPFQISGNTIYSAGSYDAFVAVFDTSGTFKWAKRSGGPEPDYGQKLKFSESFLYVAGHFSGTINFNNPADTGSNELSENGTMTDNYLAKYDLNGNFIWARRFGSTNLDIVSGIDVSQNVIYLTGFFQGLSNFNTPSSDLSNTLVSGGSDDAFLASFDTDGNFNWARRVGGTGDDIGIGIVVQNDAVYMAGYFSGSANCNTPFAPANVHIISAGATDLFLTKFDTNGDFIWAVRGGGPEGDIATGLAIKGSTLYLYGNMLNGPYNFNNGSYITEEFASAGSFDGILAKFNLDGRFEDLTRFGGTSFDRIEDVDILNQNLHVIGRFSSTINFNTPSAFGTNELSTEGINNSFTAVYKNQLEFTSEKGIGSNVLADEQGTAVVIDSLGNKYVAGYFNGTMAMGNAIILTSANGSDAFLAKYAPDGTCLWAKRAGGSNDDAAYGIALSGSSVYLVGKFQGTANFNTPSSAGSNELISESGSNDMFLAKYNKNGNLGWIRRAGGTQSDIGYGVSVDDSLVYVTGSFSNTANFNTPSSFGTNELVSAGVEDVFLAKYNSSGILKWLRRSGGSGEDVGQAVATGNGFIFCAGYFTGTSNFNTPSASGSNELISAGGTDSFIAKYAANGALIWEKRSGGIGNDATNAIDYLQGDVYTTGYFIGTANFNNPSANGTNELVSGGQRDIFVSSYGGSGSLKWIKRAGGTQNDAGNGISVQRPYVIVTGSYRTTADFNTPHAAGSNELIADGERDIFLAAYNFSGDFVESIRAGGTGDEAANAVFYDGNRIVCTGFFENTINFNTPSYSGTNELQSVGAQDIFLADESFRLRYQSSDTYDYKNGGTTYGGGIVKDNAGNIYASGQFNGILEYSDQKMESMGSSDCYLIKYNPYGKVLWARRFGGKSFELFNEMSIAGNNIYITGYFNDTLNFNTPFQAGSNELLPQITTKNEQYIVAFNQNGDYLWSMRIGGDTELVPGNIVADETGVYVNCSFSGTINFNTPAATGSNELTSIGQRDNYLAKYSSNGALQWFKRNGGPSSDFYGGISIYNGLVCTSGSFNDSTNFNTPSSFSSNKLKISTDAENVFLACYNTSGNLSFIRQIGGFDENDYCESEGLKMNENGIFLNGTFDGTINFNNPLATGSHEIVNNSYGTGIFLSGYDLNGNILWANKISSQNYLSLNGMALTGDELYITGSSNVNLQMYNPSQQLVVTKNLVNPYMGFFAKYNTNGVPVDAYIQDENSPGFEIVNLSASNKELIFTGYFTGQVNFNFGSDISSVQYALSADGYVVKLDKCDHTEFLQSTVNDYSGDKLIIASNQTDGHIQASNKIQNNSNVIYQAPVIELNPGFRVDSGNVFQTQQGGCF